MLKQITAMTTGLLMTIGVANAAEPESCKTVRFSDVGWTDITSTTAVASTILEALGYAPESKLLSIPVTYASMKNKDIDVYLGDWQPSMEADRKSFLEDKSIEVIGPNLTGAKYTFAVPKYVADAGVKDISDLQKFADKFGRKIYGIEPGNNGNRMILDMINKGDFGLTGWELVESSEQGMLAEVERATKDEQWIVFLGWAPHPMNTRYRIDYLSGADAYFGPNYGGRRYLYQHSGRLCAGMSECREICDESSLHPGHGKRDHERDIERRKGPEGSRSRLVEGSSGCSRSVA